MQPDNEELRLGIDVGSTTVKLAVTESGSGKMLYSCYYRHNARQAETVEQLLGLLEEQFPGRRFRTAVCGSGGKPVAERLGVHYIQEVVANAAAVSTWYPQARTAIELGGQDAKIIFFHFDEKTEKLVASDMRMNGSCAGGTGAFIDEIAKLLNIETTEFESLAAKGTTVFDISGRCGVFAKTDIQPLLIQGASHEDVALSVFHAIARQTIGGLAQGLEIAPPVVFEGGPLTFNPTLIRVFGERLQLTPEQIIIPEHPETIVAFGTAIAIDRIFAPTDDECAMLTAGELRERLQNTAASASAVSHTAEPFFRSTQERDDFMARHDRELMPVQEPTGQGPLQVYLGIDSGSTTSKLVLLDEDERVIDRYYANNNGEPLRVIKEGLLALADKYERMGRPLEILGLGTTGYGEKLFARALGADYHVVETVAHAKGCLQYFPNASFLLDIGGQDMKAIWLNDGIITNIMLNEACSSGCGSFLENFASNLGMPVEEIAAAAFRSENPASLGSRCTVFMNSTIINEQRDGKLPDDIMAGLCRSIIENVFTKVVRIANKDELGDHVVVQGGTFRNRAVLRALEEYLGREVSLAPYPGEMGALGAALLVKQQIEHEGYANGESTSFIGLNGLRDFDYITRNGDRCPGCANHCSRTVMLFSTGGAWVTGNRCERGATVDDEYPGEKKAGESQPKPQTEKTVEPAPDLFLKREKLLFELYPSEPVREAQGQTIGLPRVLEFWDSMPFWSTFFRALGYSTKFSHPSGRKLYEQGITYVASDTICFPAKLAHGHVMDLAEQGVDRIFMPYVMHMPPEGKDKLSPYVCSVVMGYPMVVRNSQTPEERYHIPFDTPVFHWFTEKDREKQICHYAVETLGATEKQAEAAFAQGKKALASFRQTLRDEASQILDKVRQENGFAVVLAGRPYHSDSFVCHGLSKLFANQGIPVLPVDSLPGLEKVDLHNTRIEITNDFHTRMLAGAMIAAREESLEYVQLVSFGCGHDAVLSDEIIRILTESGQKSPLVLKLDESDAAGSLAIRVQSFIETVHIRRKLAAERRSAENVLEHAASEPLTSSGSTGGIRLRRRRSQTTDPALQVYHSQYFRELPPPSPAKFLPGDRKKRTLLLPNITGEAAVLLCALLEKENFIVKSVPIGGIEQIRLGKKYVHNDICFPAQMVIGELIGELKRGNYNQDEVAVGMVKFQCDCRMSHYAGLLRKGLDAAGFDGVPVLTTDVNDTKDMHPGVALLGLSAVLGAVWGFMMLDIMTEIVRKIRPYEINPGETNRVYHQCVENISQALKEGMSPARRVFEQCIDSLAAIPYDRSSLKPRVFVTGELLVTYHPGSNFHIEEYIEQNGMETVFPRITDQLRKDFQATGAEIKDCHANIPPYPFLVSGLFDYVQRSLEKVAARHPLFEKGHSPKEMYDGVSDIIPEPLSCGEGWLMAAEIARYAKEGVRSFIILQPFGCLPNHICGRGTIKKLKTRYPDIQILPLDLDPDTSFANVENRLQMLIMNH
ncbi:MAG: acyl-CoA dehydratase activase [Oscillospiraceae bacterium]|nr:acyl-CoA dehydratase activase [Oscillospiraceae bacterium]